MNKYDGSYIHLPRDYQLWAVDIGKRRKVNNVAHMYQIGLRPVYTVSADELEAIPLHNFDDEEE